jgi:hypothetical protein
LATLLPFSTRPQSRLVVLAVLNLQGATRVRRPALELRRQAQQPALCRLQSECYKNIGFRPKA